MFFRFRARFQDDKGQHRQTKTLPSPTKSPNQVRSRTSSSGFFYPFPQYRTYLPHGVSTVADGVLFILRQLGHGFSGKVETFKNRIVTETVFATWSAAYVALAFAIALMQTTRFGNKSDIVASGGDKFDRKIPRICRQF